MEHIIPFSIPLGWSGYDAQIEFAAVRRLGLEIGCFTAGEGLNDLGVRSRMVEELKEALRGFNGRLSFHGAFLDLALHSQDREILKISRKRILDDLQTATDLGCRKIIFHTGFNPLIPASSYAGSVLDAMEEFWGGAADAFPQLTICLENQWETDWEFFEKVFRRIAHPRIRMCLDVGHANVHGFEPIESWIHALSPWISHFHWNDNHGDRDSHYALGRGSIHWGRVLEACRVLSPMPDVLLEVNHRADVIQSLKCLQVPVESL